LRATDGRRNMNAQVLAMESTHVQLEVAKKNDLIQMYERALALAVASLREVAAGRVQIEELPGSPPGLDADTLEWADFFLVQGKLEILRAPRKVAA
jgi:hypothetical protein